ncbi:MAG TPA: EF-P lysine aminoacylase EpmA [Woeseiaceae bacterium]|nr:EF-P lysine aminoacylase EpmA [Woeseiaceae bacterium]
MADWRPSGDAATARRRAILLRRVHRFFAGRGVLPVDTPALGAASVTDPSIASIAAGGGRWLQPSPEYYMKRLLAAGYPDIYAVCRVFRDGEHGCRHLPEFTLVEWYRRGFDLPRIEADTTALIAHVLPGHFAAPPEYVEYCDAFSRHAGIDPLGAPTAALAAAAGAHGNLAAALGEDRDAWLDLLLATVVAPRFAADRLTVLRHYPASQAALARLCPDDPRVADRFEVFAGDLELANGYVELTDAAEQARRMDRDRAIRHERGLPAMPRDHRLLAALAAGLPPAAGVALGFERLQMLADGASDIKNVVAFPGDLP